MASGQETRGVTAGQRAGAHHCSRRMPQLRTLESSPLEAERAVAYRAILGLREGGQKTNAQKLSRHHKGQTLSDPGRRLLLEFLWWDDLKTNHPSYCKPKPGVG